jgi:2-oxoacid:acceptor oxidoreductase delta subunit (pyruvate/2-ketoisovalerate family)
MAYEGPVRGAPAILATGNAQQRQTGNWRVTTPLIDRDRCTRCGLCFVQCPDGAIALDAEGYPVIDYDHCKGCMICRQVCPIEAISLEKEVRAW